MLRTLFLSLVTSASMISSWFVGADLPLPKPIPEAVAEEAEFAEEALEEIFYQPEIFFEDTTKKKIDSDTLPPYNRDRYGHPYSVFRSRSPLLLQMPGSYKFGVTIDTSGQYYNLDEKIGNSYYRNPSRMTFDEYRDWRSREHVRSYWKNAMKDTSAAGDKATGDKGNSLIPSLPKIPFAAARFLGGDSIVIKPNGSLMLDFGGRWQRIDNPSIPVRQQRNGGFEFDQQIQMSLTGQVGKKLKLNANMDTKSSFQFEQKYNMTYNSFEEDIVQEVQFGNLDFKSSNSLITGSQNLFGVSTKMRFGKLWIRGVASNQRGSIETLTIKNGAQGREFEILASNYEMNRHFFLAQFFRDNYERGLASLPLVNTGVNITRVEVYVTNRNNDTESQRNVLASMDLGEPNAYRSEVPFVGQSPNGWPSIDPAANDANSLYGNLDGSSRDPDNIPNDIESQGLQRGIDFELLQRARKLKEGEYKFHPQLGYITLFTPIRNDEVLAVAFEYTYNGQAYQVGELTENYQNLGDDDVVHLKMLSPSTINPSLPMWDLMMKNIYSLQTTRIQQENFQLRVIYRDDLTGQDNPSLHEGVNTKDVPLVQLLNLDRLNPSNELQVDGNFDYLPQVTIDEQNGRVIFPVVEPFGDHLRSKFNESELEFLDKYVFDELYDGTQADAELNTTKNKFLIKGSYQSGTGTDIMLNAFNIAENSVVVRAGNTVLIEGTDYQVDYQSGRVRITNTGVMASGKEIKIQYERADPFNFQVRTLAGMDAEYHVNKNLKLNGTLLYYNERPAITRVNIGREPVRNTLWGVGVDWRTKSRLLTKAVDFLPFVDTKKESDVTIKAEFAQILPGSPRQLGKDGSSYIDDFEGAEVPYDMTRSPISWALGSTPQRILNRNPNTGGLSSGYRRAKLAWYNIDNIFYFNSGAGNFQRPANITDEDMQHHYVRAIRFNEVFPNKQAEQINLPEVSFDLAYYPEERGPYNYNPDLEPNGNLSDPKENFGAITRAITSDIDFDNINIQYIEFWMMDPFMSGENAELDGESNTTGGKFFINLGNISEDVVPDGKHFFENGLPSEETSIWGRVPTEPFLTNAFDADNAKRAIQDVGFDGLTNADEVTFFSDFLNQAAANGVDITGLQNDPSNDDFQYYLGGALDESDAKVLDRYKHFNNSENNSPVNNGGANFVPSNTNQPDNEDLNRDNTLSALDQYFEYELDIRPGLSLEHPYVVDQVESQDDATGETVNWYQFRIPIRDQAANNVNGISGFKSIRYMRVYMTDWQQPVVLRMVKFQLVGAQWRPFLEAFNEGGLSEPVEPGNLDFSVSTVNIEENGTTSDGGESEIPYTLPPGISRDFDVTSQVSRRLNEQSLQVCADELPDNQARAVYKNIAVDMVNYGRLKMEIHAHSPDGETLDDALVAFVRLGTDFQQNFYEIEIPLKMTQPGSTAPSEIWLAENRLDIELKELYEAKVRRNRSGTNKLIPYTVDVDGTQYKIKVVGNPDLSAVKTAMLGVRNPQDDNRPLSVCAWFNELRVTDFNKQAGWATNIRMGVNLADFATVNTTLQYSTVGFGGIQERISDRQRSDNLDFDISSNINLDKILLNKIGISLPMYVSYERHTKNPFFNPLDPDVPLEAAVDAFDDLEDQQSYLDKVRDITVRRSINFTNIKKRKLKKDAKSHIWDIENISLSAAYSDEFRRNNNIDEYSQRRWSIGGNYRFAFKNKGLEPFKKSKSAFFKTAYGKPFRDLSFNPLPTSIAATGKLDRRYIKTQLRNGDLETDGILPTFEKTYYFNRTYSANWSLTKSLTVTYQANANAIIDEPSGNISDDFANDSIRANLLKLGRMKLYTQNISGNYTLPLNKFPITDWFTATARYNANYTWQAGTVGLADTLGHIIKNQGNTVLNGKIDLTKIYKKNAYLKSLSTGSRMRQRSGDKSKGKGKRNRSYDPLENQKKHANEKVKKLKKRMGKREWRKTKRYEKKLPKREEEYKDDGLPIPPPVKSTKRSIGRLGRKMDKLKTRLSDIEKKKKARGDAPSMFALNMLANTLISVKNITINASQQGSTTLPGFMQTPLYMGLDENQAAPGIPFLLGSQDPNIRFEAARNGWLASNESQNMPFQQTQNQTFTMQSRVEPHKNVKIQLKASRRRGNNYTEVFRFIPDQDNFEIQAPVRSGNYGISFFTLPTAFEFDNTNHTSDAFEAFAENRAIIQQRYKGVSMDPNSQDVLVPAFIAAYTGKSPDEVELTSFPGIPIPNWTLNITGLEKAPMFKDKVKSISIRHGYKSEYSIGDFTSSLFYSDPLLGYDLSLRQNERFLNDPIANDSGQVVPILVMGQVRVQESFSPLIGINIRLKNNFSFKADINKSRNIGLMLTNAQITEQRNTSLVLDVAYSKKKMLIPPIFTFRRSSIVLPNEVQFRMAFTIRNTKTFQRALETGSTVTQGNLNMQIRPTITYKINKAANIQMYFERQINQPYVSNSFRRTSTSFGFQFRYNLTQK